MSAFNYPDRTLRKVNESHEILQDDFDFRSGSAIILRDPSLKQGSTYTWKLIITILLLLGGFAIVYIYLLKSGILKSVMVISADWLSTQNEEHPLLVMVIFYVIINLLMVLSLGFKMIVFITAYLVLRSPVAVFLLLVISSVSGDLLVFLVCRFWLRTHIVRKFKDYDIYIILLEESKSEPFKTAVVTRLLLIPNGLKNYVLMAIDNPPASYFISGFVFHALFIIEVILVASQFSQIEEFFSKEKSWEEKTDAQKWTFVVFSVFVVGIVLLGVCLGIWAKKKMDLKKRERNEMIVRDLEMR